MAASPDSNLCNQKVSVFLEECNKPETQKLFKRFAELTREKCEELLKNMNINGVVQSRSKGYESLKTKLNGMAETSEFRNWVVGTGVWEEPNLSGEDKDDTNKHSEENSGGSDKRGRDIYEHPDLGDLAGVRIGLLLPGHVAKVAEEINKIFNVSHTFGTVTDTTRTAVDGRNRDIQKHGDGRWISQAPGQDVHHWEHYGYKSWQVVVGWKHPLPEELELIEADLASTGIFGLLRVEIQVGTVVTQAWAEVQHNIIYKSSNDIQATTTMKRMIDAINGLAITTDIMLTELERSQAQAEKEAAEQRELEKRLPQIMLSTACLKGDLRAVKRLLKDGVDVNTKEHARGLMLLHRVSRNGYDKVVKLLLNNGANINAEDQRGYTALHEASLKGHDKVVKQLLLKDGVDVNAKENEGDTALHLASHSGHDKAVEQLLLKEGVDVNAKNKDGQTALHCASSQGHDKVVKQLLLKDGVGVNAKDKFGDPAIHSASFNGHDKVVELLLKGGIELNATDKRTMLDLASQRGHDKVVELLRSVN